MWLIFISGYHWQKINWRIFPKLLYKKSFKEKFSQILQCYCKVLLWMKSNKNSRMWSWCYHKKFSYMQYFHSMRTHKNFPPSKIFSYTACVFNKSTKLLICLYFWGLHWGLCISTSIWICTIHTYSTRVCRCICL